MKSAKSMWFWNSQVGPWKVWGLWWKRRVMIGVSIINKNEEWTIN